MSASASVRSATPFSFGHQNSMKTQIAAVMVRLLLL